MRAAVLGLLAGAIPALASQSWEGEHKPSQHVVRKTKTITTTVCPCSTADQITTSGTSPATYEHTTSSGPVEGTTSPSGYKGTTSSGPVKGTTTSPSGPYETSSTAEGTLPGGYGTTVVDWTTDYTTICPVTETITKGTHTHETVYTTTSTVPTTYQYTVTITPTPSQSPITLSSTTTEPTPYTTVCTETDSNGSTYVTTKTTSETESATGSGSITSATGPTTSGPVDISTYTTVCTSTVSGSTVIETHTHSKPIYGNGTETSTGYHGTGTGSATITSSATGNSTSTSTKTSSSTGSASTCSKPKPTDSCVPCEGQSGSPENHCGLDINTDYYKEAPNTCKTVEYDFDVSQVNIAPDGVERIGLVVNGQMPGPMIEANWGDWIVVHLTNSMPLNGTSIHFHGIRQNYTNEMDGVPSITQCPLAPGEKMTYRFRATQYGSSWWHSHFAIQTYEGVFGPLVIHGPNTGGSYDAEHMIVLQDWNHETVDSIYEASVLVANNQRSSPTLDTGLINGMNVWPPTPGLNGNSTGGPPSNTTGGPPASGPPSKRQDGPPQTGKRFEMDVVKGQTYRLRIVNTAIQASFKFYIDGHKFKVIANDFVPIEPYETDMIMVNIGQRYDVLVTFDQEVDNYWMRSDNQQACGSPLKNSRDVRGIVRYKGASEGLPTSTGPDYQESCLDEPYDKLVPALPMNAGAMDQTVTENVLIGANGKNPNLFKWTLSGTSFQSFWDDPTLYQINQNGSVREYEGQNAIEVADLDEWVYIIIETVIPLPHPIHLHGHDFMILSQGPGQYDSSIPLKTINPPRRDVANMNSYVTNQGPPTGGYLVIAFQANNPGAWLLHCHIGWHVAMGFALQIIENLEGIKPTLENTCQMNDVCASWQKYSAANGITAAPFESGV